MWRDKFKITRGSGMSYSPCTYIEFYSLLCHVNTEFKFQYKPKYISSKIIRN